MKTIGPLMIDLEGLTLTTEEKQLLQHPIVGGVILFSRNYQSKNQLHLLVKAIREINPVLLIAVDQEGGRVQRFKEDFIKLPSMKEIGEVYLQSSKEGCIFSHHSGYTMAVELLQAGIDFSFAPVLDLNLELNNVIGDRAFSSSPTIVAELATYFMKGMHEAGMAAVGKHFPGHGSVTLDSHVSIPISALTQEDMMFQEGLQPFKDLIKAGIEGIMAAHIIFKNLDLYPVGFSPYWLSDILRKKCHFEGAIFSDDLTMEGASAVGDMQNRVKLALAAGCDMVLICNQRNAIYPILDTLKDPRSELSQRRLQTMRKKSENIL